MRSIFTVILTGLCIIFQADALAQQAKAAATPPAAAINSKQEIWFSPRQHWKPGTGVADWHEQFLSDASWPKAAAKVKVFVLTEGPIRDMTDAELATMAGFLTKHRMEIALEMGIIEKEYNSKYGGGEGYMFPGEIGNMAKRLRQAGITPNYIRMDEPIWFGHYNKNDAYCQQLSIDDLVKRIARNAREMTGVFPDMKIVDIVTIPPLTMQSDWRQTYKEFKEKLEAALGKPITAVQVDVQWSNPSWKHDLKEFADYAHGLGMKVGIIYNSDGGGANDREWLQNAEKGFTKIESELGLIPEQPVMQSWESFPTRSLPETSDTAHTYLIARYLLPRTRIAAQRKAESIEGLLIDERGRPVSGAKVTMDAPVFTESKPLPVVSASGTVPNKAKSAIMGIRINCECLSDGKSDLLVGKFTYQESGTGTVSKTLDYPAEVQRSKPPKIKAEITTVGGQSVAHLMVDPGQTVGFNSPAFAVTPGAQYQFRAQADLISGEGLYGRIILIWLDDKNHGISACPLIVTRKYTPCSLTVTGKNGQFSIALPKEKNATAGPLRLSFAGTPELRPAITVIP